MVQSNSASSFQTGFWISHGNEAASEVDWKRVFDSGAHAAAFFLFGGKLSDTTDQNL